MNVSGHPSWRETAHVYVHFVTELLLARLLVDADAVLLTKQMYRHNARLALQMRARLDEYVQLAAGHRSAGFTESAQSSAGSA